MSYKINIDRRITGLNFTDDGSAELLVWAPFAEKVEAIVNDRIFNTGRQDHGYWFLKTGEIKPGDLYKVRIDGQKAYPDPASLSQPEGVHGPSAAFDTGDFSWDDTGWKGPETSEIIFYELHTGTFSRSGTFEGIEEKTGYLLDLGINAVEIMPVAQFPGSRNWGYDGVFPFAVQNSYGGPHGLQKLVNACHKKGISVILDVVYNHLGPEGNYLPEFGPYFTDKYKTPWGKAVNFDDEWCFGVRQFYIENMLSWFRDFHIDGLRLDAVHAIRDFSPKHIMQELRENADKLENITGRKYLLIAETDLNDTRFIRSVSEGGYGLDMQWCDEFHHSLHALVTGEVNGYYSDFGELWQAKKSLGNAYVYDGIYSSHRKKFFGTPTGNIPGDKFVVFIQNHDHIGNRMLGERINRLTGHEQLKLLAGTMFISPFIPLLFMGEEYNESHPFLYFTSHTDEELARLVKEGRANEFREFINDSEVPDPQSEQVFNESKLTFGIDPSNRHIFDYYRELIKLKKTHPLWKDHDRSHIKVTEAAERTLVFSKKKAGKTLLAILNFDNKEFVYETNDVSGVAGFKVLLDSADKKWGGSRGNSKTMDKKSINARAHSIVVLSDII